MAALSTESLQSTFEEKAVGYERILVAVDSSDHSNCATVEAVRFGQFWDSHVTGLHAYAGKLHDTRFRQMEGSLPKKFQKQKELERQRNFHDTLISRGLSMISESYLDQTEACCEKAGVAFSRLGVEGKNYRVVVDEVQNADHDLVVLGSEGLGSVTKGSIGTVCERVVRRTTIDALVVKSTERRVGEGPIVVGVDGSAESFGALVTALELGERFGVSVQAVAAYDPFYHYVAFNRISEVLSANASKVFKFKEQKKLHGEVIDTGLAKVYGAHLAVAESIAASRGVQLETALLKGKPSKAISKYLGEVNASLLVLGKVGLHADDDLDLGGTTEQMLRLAECNLLVTVRTHVPDPEDVARETVSWTREAEARMERVPGFVRNMAEKAITKYTIESGHTVVTDSIVDAALADLMPHGDPGGREVAREPAHEATETTALAWDDDANALAERVPEGFMRQLVIERVEVLAQELGAERVTADMVRKKYDGWAAGSARVETRLDWDDDARERVERAPDFVRGMVVREVERSAERNGLKQVSLEYLRQVRQGWQERGDFHAAPS